MMRHEFEIRPMDAGLRRAGLSRAWAILRPMPGKEGLLVDLLRDQDWEWQRPMTVTVRRVPPSMRGHLVDTPALPGYMFVRPPSGQRRALLDLPFVAAVLPVVVFDVLVLRFAAEVARERAEREAALTVKPVRRSRGRKPKFDESITATPEMTAFQRLKFMLDVEARALPVDIPRIRSHESAAITESAAVMATLDDYLGTDDFGNCAPNVSAKAMVRRRNFFT